jgi:hypothetical protein
VLSDLVRELEGLSPGELRERLRERLPDLPLADRFDLLHRLGIYRHRESASGAASTLRETAAIRAELPRLFASWHVASVLDIPCGDFHWLSRVAMDVDYTGADIVSELVEANRRAYASDARRFAVLDATSDPLPRVDLVLCRDLLIHLSNRDCRRVLANVVASGSQLLLTNHFVDRADNPDILSGDFRPINLCAPPFSFPAPIWMVSEHSELGDGAFADRSMALWRISDLADRIVGKSE